MSERSRLPLILLLIGCFLCPLAGGQLSLDSSFQALTSAGGAVGALWGGIEAPLVGHAVISLLFVASLVVMLLGRKIIQVPNSLLSGVLIVFFILLAGTTMYSNYKAASAVTAASWLTYSVAFYAVVAGGGRRIGPVAILAALTAGTTIIALWGILEYQQSPPDWRIFARWNNPNAAAAMLLVGFFCGATLTLTRTRTEAIAAGAATLAIGAALILTQSRGGLLSLGVGLVALLVLAIAWAAKEQRKTVVLRLVAVGAMVALFAVGLQLKSASVGGSSTISRVSEAQATSEQSAGFRLNLWKTSVELTKSQPVGHGIGTFRYVSAKPGITTQTQLAHNLYLQLMAEASPVSLVLLLAAAGMWLVHMFKGARRLPASQNLTRAGVISAILAVGAHSVLDSDLYYFGVGASFFVLLGVGMLLASDAVAPENLPAPARRTAAVAITCLGLAMLYFAHVDVQKALLRGALLTQNAEDARGIAAHLRSIAPRDPESWSLSARGASDRATFVEYQKLAAAVAPTTRYLRSLARIQIEDLKLADALGTLQRALELDPNNLETLWVLSEVQEAIGDQAGVQTTLRRILAVEQTPYYTVRSLPEVVPTQTARARLKLASQTAVVEERIELLRGAVETFERYRVLTIPRIESMTAEDPNGNYAGETLALARENMEFAAAAAEELAELYRAAGDPAGAAGAEEAAGEFRSAL